ncbi:hypothetical protein BGZ83_010693 [Gryganskiella cystojenkinii]|nr:hypothetical protein BGZ83_010693 [Gryganskiella cystojenkinii]
MFSITELDEMVFFQLDPQDLLSCLLVCKKWSINTLPFIWRDISDIDHATFYTLWQDDYLHTAEKTLATATSDQNASSRSLTHNNLPTLTKYGDLIQILPSPSQLLFILDGGSFEPVPISPSKPSNRSMLEHLLHVRCPQALRSHTHLDINAKIVAATECLDFLLDMYAPLAKSIAFGNGRWGALTLRPSVLHTALDKCSDKLERLTLKIRMTEEHGGYPARASRADAQTETEDVQEKESQQHGNEEAETRSTPPFPFRLKSFEFQDLRGSDESSDWIWNLLTPCCESSLEHLQLCYNLSIFASVKKTLERFVFPRLDSIQFGGAYSFEIHPIPDFAVAAILRSHHYNLHLQEQGDQQQQHQQGQKDEEGEEERQIVSTDWKHISILDMAEFGQETLEALKIHGRKLESFTLEGYRSRDLDATLIQILKHLPCLKTFCVPDITASEDENFSQQPISASAFIRPIMDPVTGLPLEPLTHRSSVFPVQFWPCTNTLTSLRICITGIPRPDLAVEQRTVEWVPEAFPGDGRGLQMGVYHRLGMLVNLERLWLGVDPLKNWTRSINVDEDEEVEQEGVETGFRTRCDGLEMTLARGLGAMRNLQKLKELNVMLMGHRIELLEVRWMTETWPNLEALYGLDPREHPDGTDVESVTWIKRNRPWIQVEMERSSTPPWK